MMGVRNGDLRPEWPAATPAPLVQLASACLMQDASERPTFESVMQQLTNMEGDMRIEEYAKRTTATGRLALEVTAEPAFSLMPPSPGGEALSPEGLNFVRPMSDVVLEDQIKVVVSGQV